MWSRVGEWRDCGPKGEWGVQAGTHLAILGPLLPLSTGKGFNFYPVCFWPTNTSLVSESKPTLRDSSLPQMRARTLGWESFILEREAERGG